MVATTSTLALVMTMVVVKLGDFNAHLHLQQQLEERSAMEGVHTNMFDEVVKR